MAKESFKPNIEQQQAIDTLQGPVMLLAGPGTGKTFTLIKRIEKIIREGCAPKNILCLTFSDAASNEMKTRLIESIGIEAGAVNISTYHGFCMDVIRQNPMDFDMTEGVQKADDVTRQTILKECIDEFGEIEFLKDKWGNKYHYLSSILNGIDTIKRERTTKEDFFSNLENDDEWQVLCNFLKEELKERELTGKATKTCAQKLEAQERKIGKAKEFYSIFKLYERKLGENNLIEYSDMINFVLNKMEEDDIFLENIAKDYKYVLVDEYQDTNKVQNDLIFNILKGAKTDNIFVVGDDDQIIYSFQGARSRNLGDFLDKYPNTKIICLKENRRSTQTILDFSKVLIKDDRFRLQNSGGAKINKDLIAKNDTVISKDKKIKFNIYSETIQENNTITEEIENLLKEGVKPSEVAILARKNDYLENFGRLLKQKNIPYVLSKQKNAYDIPSFIQAYFYLKILSNSFISQDKFFGLLSKEPFKIKDETLAKLLLLSKKKDQNIFITIKEALNDSLKDDLKLSNFVKTYENLRAKKDTKGLLGYIYEVITETGILEFYSNTEAQSFENISAIQRLADEAKSYTILHKGASLEDFVDHLDTYFTQDIKIELSKPQYEINAVQLLTYHGSKGREFEHVFMPDLTANSFEKKAGNNKELSLPIKKSVFSEDKDLNKDAELIRLLFVGVTRAKHDLHLSYATAQDGSQKIASKYIANLFPENNHLVEKKVLELSEKEKAEEIIKNLKITQNNKEYEDELKLRVENLVISQTSLNKYINCPLQYFYSDILFVPVFIEDKDILSYGSSIHYAIEFMTKDGMKTKTWGAPEVMLQKFKEKMDEADFTSFDKKDELIKRGEKAIAENYAKLTEANPESILYTEYAMETNFEGTVLKGFADRISKNNDGTIEITDFKTGSYKKVRPDENYYNQLRFYKFLFEETNKNSKVAQTSLCFFEEGCKTSAPEPDLTDNEEIKEKIRTVINKIKELNFEPKPSKETCKFCNYKLICKLNKED